MAINIADLTLDEVVQHLAAGNVLLVSGDDQFTLPLQDSRTVLAFYNQNRQAYWNPDKDTNILGSVDKPVLLPARPGWLGRRDSRVAPGG